MRTDDVKADGGEVETPQASSRDFGSGLRSGRWGWYAVRMPTLGKAAVWLAVGVLVLIAVLCACAPLITDLDPLATDTTARNLPLGSPGHLLGTDTLGHDLLTRLLYGGRTSLLVGVSAAGATVLIGVLLGALAAQGPRWLDGLVTRVADTMLALPLLIVVLALSAVFGGSLTVVIVAIALTSWMPVALITRAELRTQRQRRYVRAATSLGLSPGQVLWRHTLPGALPPIASIAAFEVGHAILTESTLSFLGLGVPANRPAWGTLLNNAQSHLLTGQWCTVALPAGAIIVTILAVNVIASGLSPVRSRAW